MPHRAAHDCSSGWRKYDSGWPATPVHSSNPHSSVLPVRGVPQIKYESARPAAFDRVGMTDSKAAEIRKPNQISTSDPDALPARHRAECPERQAGSGGLTGMLFVRATSVYQRALCFGMRRWVPKSTKTSPNRWEYPSAHSKLSRNDQTK